MVDQSTFEWRSALQRNYLVVAIGLLAAGGTGALAAYATVNEFVESKFDEFSKGRSMVTRSDLTEYEIPKDAIGLFLGPCPKGWKDFQQAFGRYLVVVGSSNFHLVGTQVGSPLVGDENRPAGKHEHGYVVDEHLNRQGAVQLEFRSPGGGHMPTVSRTTDSGSGLKEGTNAPYLLVTGCLRE